MTSDRLRTVTDYISFFDNIEDCREFLEAMVAVTFGHLAERLITTMYNFNQIFSIHHLIRDDLGEKEWISKYPRV